MMMMKELKTKGSRSDGNIPGFIDTNVVWNFIFSKN